ncbi:MAG: hypothetical protein FJ029_09650 [Actinobacteria bacterium]|nr:hypothetical protein [Actinomycetota bacterium]
MPERVRPSAGGPPDAAYVASLEQALPAEFGARNALIERLRRLRYMEEPVAIPEAYRAIAPEVRTPLAPEQVKRVVGSLTANEPLITVPPPDASEAARRAAGRREQWTKAALRRMEDEAARDVFGMFVDALVSDGAGVMKLVYVPDRWAAYPRRDQRPDEPDEAFNSRATLFKKAATFPLAWPGVTWTC